jgi:hypothetical protein
MDPAESPTNPELIDAMAGVAHNDNGQTRRALYEALVNSTLLVPTAAQGEDPQPGWHSLEEDTQLQFIVLTNPQGQTALPVFTDEEALRLWQPEGAPYVAFHAHDLFALALQNNADALVVNVAGPTGGEITRHELSVLAQGTLPDPDGSMTIDQDTQVLIGAPSDPPQQLLDSLREGMAAHPEISAGYLTIMAIGAGEPHFVAGVRFSREPTEEAIGGIMRDLSDTVRSVLAPDQYLDFVVVDDSDFGKAVESSGIAVFRR